jgi:hypothetical protein
VTSTIHSHVHRLPTNKILIKINKIIIENQAEKKRFLCCFEHVKIAQFNIFSCCLLLFFSQLKQYRMKQVCKADEIIVLVIFIARKLKRKEK